MLKIAVVYEEQQLCFWKLAKPLESGEKIVNG
jgi:hypothetical protein